MRTTILQAGDESSQLIAEDPEGASFETPQLLPPLLPPRAATEAGRRRLLPGLLTLAALVALGVAAVAIGRRPRGMQVGSGAVSLMQVTQGTTLQVTKQGDVFRSIDTTVENPDVVASLPAGWQVIAAGPPEVRAGVQVLPIQAVIDPTGVIIQQVGAVKLQVLRYDDSYDFGEDRPETTPAPSLAPLPNGLPYPAPLPPPPRSTTPAPAPHPSPVGETCTDFVVERNYKICKNTYCGQDITEGGTSKVANDAECRALCDKSTKCVAYEIYRGRGTDCTLRPSCVSPVRSDIGTFVAFKGNWGPLPTTLPATTAAPGGNPSPSSSSSTLALYDCDAAFDSWQTSWSLEKQSWCCGKFSKGCAGQTSTTSQLFDCAYAVGNWRIEWSQEKQSWCCKRYQLGCPDKVVTYTMTTLTGTITTYPATYTATSTTSTSSSSPIMFNCSEGYGSWRTDWSVWKKRFCCTTEQRGCPDSRHIMGSLHVRNVRWQALETQKGIMEDFKADIKKALAELAGGGSVMDTVTMKRLRMLAATTASASTASADRVKVDLDLYESPGGNVVVQFVIRPPEELPIYLARSRVTTEAVEREVLKAVLAVPNIGAVSVTPIRVAQCEIELATARVPCFCTNGLPQTDLTCPGAGGHYCGSCNLGYRLTDTYRCVANQCKCDNGIAAAGAACHTDGKEVCGYCNQGRHVEVQADKSVKCVANICSCQNGVPSKGPRCLTHNGNICESCQAGYHVDATTFQCLPNECSCMYGVKLNAGDPLCTYHQAEICRSCYQFYHLQTRGRNKKCVLNECVCENGTQAVGIGPPGCIAQGANVCVNCNSGLALNQDYACGEKTCVCRNGTAATGAECTSNSGNICKSCKRGFALVNKQCVKDTCTCANGQPAYGDGCDLNGVEKCLSCDSGYHLVDRQCKPNVCVCEAGTGTPATGAMCQVHRGNVCADCKAGYYMVASADDTSDNQALTVKCEANVCTCSHGTPATAKTTAVLCHTNGAEVCLDCEPGYEPGLATPICQPKVCTCANGVGATLTECQAGGTENCKSCNMGYHLTSEDVQLNGTQRCRRDAVTTKPLFDCAEGYANRLLGWSSLKQNWCCENRGIGCDATSDTGKQACESVALSESQCQAVGCCRYDANAGCQSAVGNGMCHQTLLLKLKASVVKDGDRGLCAKATSPYTPGKTVTLAECNEYNLQMQWQYNSATEQVRNVVGLCLAVNGQSIPKDRTGIEFNQAVLTQTCADYADLLQKWHRDSDGHLKMPLQVGDTTITACLSVDVAQVAEVGAVLKVRECAADSLASQQWKLPETAMKTWTSTTTRTKTRTSSSTTTISSTSTTPSTTSTQTTTTTRTRTRSTTTSTSPTTTSSTTTTSKSTTTTVTTTTTATRTTTTTSTSSSSSSTTTTTNR